MNDNARKSLSGLPRAQLLLLLSLSLLLPKWAKGGNATPGSADQLDDPIPATFFAMSAWHPSRYPAVKIGTLAHGELAWAMIESSKGNFDFTLFDDRVAAAQEHGLVDPNTNTVNMAMTLGMTPGWAVRDKSTCSSSPGFPDLIRSTAAPDDLQDWKDFLTALLRHYNGKTQPHIKYYELWNEMNLSMYWTDKEGATYQEKLDDMVTLARAAYPIIHRDPYSMLLTPSMGGGIMDPAAATCPYQWMEDYLKAGGHKYADGGAFHGYLAFKEMDPYAMPEEDTTVGCAISPQVCYGSIITKATKMREIFDAGGLAGKPMFQTEGSWGDGTVTDPNTQVAWLARYYLLQAGLRSTLNLQMAAWFTWGLGAGQWGVIETAAGTPTAAGLAYEQVYDWVVGATISEPCTSNANGTWTCTLTRPDGYVAHAVWNTKGTIIYKPGPKFTQYRDLAGNTMPISARASILIGAKPILVEGKQ